MRVLCFILSWTDFVNLVLHLISIMMGKFSIITYVIGSYQILGMNNMNIKITWIGHVTQNAFHWPSRLPMSVLFSCSVNISADQISLSSSSFTIIGLPLW